MHGKLSNEFLSSLLGHEYDFYGTSDNTFCIGVGKSRLVIEAYEDQAADDYRSYFGGFRIAEYENVFFKSPIAKVLFKKGGMSDRSSIDSLINEKVDNFSGWILMDPTTEHVWLTIGTDYGMDYYPCFTFRYTPDTNVTVNHENTRDTK